ncbi:hypothetical protein A3D00_03490 [Candidatus Woesebacteria bacterium RIFCSPHIGHO2_02_FULL_38_9]|nr:MAG: hypothetical protein A3D00_03490 [Candidatus Woesebacteria bacterium RIFCSPHIGHO2_02_FULL_38_9]OGM58752.1 MAG: hypothetical protein A3A50_03115 [Candidatus Woesebacteria bacterium RIFCSPLOWO2_01_FULL_38_20]
MTPFRSGNRFGKLIVIFLLLVIPLLYSNLFFESFELPKFIFFIIAIDVLFLVFVFGNLRKAKFNADLYDVLAIVWIVIMAGSALAAGNFWYSFWGGFFRHQGIFFYIHLVAMFIVLRRFCHKHEYLISYALKCLIIASLIQSGIILLQWMQLKLGVDITSYNGRPVGTIGQPNSAAGFIAVGYAVMLGHNFISKNKTYLIGALFCLLGILATRSLGGFLTVLVVSFIFLFRYLSSKNIKILTLCVFFLLLLGVLYLGLAKEKITTDSLGNRRVESRLSIWQASITLFLKRPLVGYGAENLGLVFPSEYGGASIDRAHNDFLDILLTGGIFLGIIYVWMVIAALYKTVSKRKMAPIFLALIAVLTRGLTEPSLIVNLIVFWLVILFALI